MAKTLQLQVTLAKGGNSAPKAINPDGSQDPFAIPNGMKFVVTDITISRLSVVGTSGLFFVQITQNVGSPATAVTLRWAFVGTVAENVERSFTTGIEFNSPFVIGNGSQSADGVNVWLSGYFD